MIDSSSNPSSNPLETLKPSIASTSLCSSSLNNVHESEAPTAPDINVVVSPWTTHAKGGWETQIRRAAGGKDEIRLQSLIATFGLTAADLDQMATLEDGKSALHMAAWKGSLSNLEFLLKLGCNVNNISRGAYSYGKTPIFFAVTQCRDDAVLLLLRHGAHVRIVNNKGQSVLSLASSHLSTNTIQRIQQAEAEQEHLAWVNYRLSHSDGAVYGDLDPRFYVGVHSTSSIMFRTDLAINPTTRQSRRGAFARRNPDLVYQEKLQHNEQKQRRVSQPKRRSDINNNNHYNHIVAGDNNPAMRQLRQEQEEVWYRLKSTKSEEITLISQLLLSLIKLYMKERREWISEAAHHLEELGISKETMHVALQDLEIAVGKQPHTEREWVLLQKVSRMHAKLTSTDEATEMQNDDLMGAAGHNGNFYKIPKEMRQRMWQDAGHAVRGLTPALLQNPCLNLDHLSLPNPPIWVDTPNQLQSLEERLRHLDDDKPFTCIAFDTEWSHKDDGETQVSTLQLAIYDRENGLIPTWIVDLQSPELKPHAVKFLQWLLHESKVYLLGFAVGRDLRKLEEYIALKGTRSKPQRTQKMVLDLQVLCAECMSSTSQQPGLQACCQRFVSTSYSLTKKEQCSEWARRPLTSAQLEYAGLDAAVLLVLLAQLLSSS